MKKLLATLLVALPLLPLRLEAQPPIPVLADASQLPSYLREQLTSPEGTVEAFLQSLDTPIWSAQLVQGTKLENLAQYEKDFRKADQGINASIQDIRIEPHGDKQVTAHVKISFYRDWASPFFRVSREDRLTLQHKEGIWKIVPADPRELLQQSKPGSDINYLLARATALAFPEQMFDFVHAQECRSNLKQLGLGMMQLVQDYEEKYAIVKAAQQHRTMNNSPNVDWQNIPAFGRAVFPYVRSGEVFHCPSDAEAFISYSFNPNLEDVALSAVTEPTKVVLFYEGKDGTLNFRHDGKANVTFADGHVESVDAARAKALKWKP